MSATNTTAAHALLEMIAADEQSVLRVGALARGLLARHADLPLAEVHLKYGGEIHLEAPTAEDVRVWAVRLGAQATEKTEDPGYGVFQHTSARTTIDDALVHIWHCRILSDAEATAWRESEGQS
ncbi:hypothetical protein [Streptomyces cucumeris]|uniref:hypothetical protein n=1 Tax=Streptomyces cucumeris TaxID=2962890 RepID=UPI003D733BC0